MSCHVHSANHPCINVILNLLTGLLKDRDKGQLSFFLIMGGRALKSRPESRLGGFCLLFLPRAFYFCITLTYSLHVDCKSSWKLFSWNSSWRFKGRSFGITWRNLEFQCSRFMKRKKKVSSTAASFSKLLNVFYPLSCFVMAFKSEDNRCYLTGSLGWKSPFSGGSLSSQMEMFCIVMAVN